MEEVARQVNNDISDLRHAIENPVVAMGDNAPADL